MRTLSRAVAAAAGAAVLAVAVPAAAHVSVSSPDAARGGYATITFSVPNEIDTAATTGVTVQLPTGTPIAAVSVQPKSGWTWKATKEKLATPVTTDDGQVTEAVARIDWTATGKGIGPGEFDQFVISAGPLPDTDAVTFKVLQTYADGTVSRWIETPAPGSDAEPEHPAPVLALAAASGQDHHATSSTAAAADSTSGSGSDGGAIVLGVIALVVALAALGLGVVTRVRAARP